MKFFIYTFIFLFLISCSLPKDPEDSLTKAKMNGLKVGYVYNPPYNYTSGDTVSGTEISIIKAFAKEQGLKIQFIYGSESELIKQLEEYKLHVIIGGFDKKTIWKDKAGPTTTYNNKNCLLVPKGENNLLYKLESYLLKYKKENGY